MQAKPDELVSLHSLPKLQQGLHGLLSNVLAEDGLDDLLKVVEHEAVAELEDLAGLAEGVFAEDLSPREDRGKRAGVDVAQDIGEALVAAVGHFHLALDGVLLVLRLLELATEHGLEEVRRRRQDEPVGKDLRRVEERIDELE